MNLGGTFLVVQWLRLRTSNARGMSLIPGRGNKIPQPVWCSQKKKKKEEPGKRVKSSWTTPHHNEVPNCRTYVKCQFRSSAEKEDLSCILKTFQDLNCWWDTWTASWMQGIISSDDFKCQATKFSNSDLRSFGLLLSYLTRSWGVDSSRICIATQPYHQYFVLLL